MKKILIISISILAAIAFATSCNTVKTTVTPAWGETVSIQASIPDDGSKVSLTPSGPDLHLAWEEGDALRVVSGSASEVFDIKPGFTDHEATFTGTAIEGETFDIIYPGIEANVGEATANAYVPQTQDGNGSTAHLKYSAALVGVDSYSEISFSDAWAAAHGGSLKRSGVIKLVLTLPESATTLESVTVDVNGTEMQLGLTNVDVSASEQVLTAYVTTPWDDVVLSAGEQFTVRVIGADKTVFDIAYVHPKDLTFAAGRMSVVTMSSGFEELPFFGGSGTSDDPWLIANAKHLQNVNAKLEDNTTKYFKLVADIDMEGESWTRLNSTDVGGGSWPKGIDFNGNGKTISNLNNSFIYVLQGSVYDLTLDHSTVSTGGGKSGILASFIKVAGNTIANVDIINSSITGTNTNGGLIGLIDGDASSFFATISDCDISNTNVTGGGVTGGVIGFADARVSVSSCTYSGGTVTVNGRFGGGFVGSTLNAQSSFTDCHVRSATVDFSGASLSNDGRFGGFAGQLQTGIQTKGCTVGTAENKVLVKVGSPYLGADGKVGGTDTNADKPLNAGGFAGTNYGTITNNGPSRSQAFVTITSNNTNKGAQLNLGGFVGYNTGTIEYSDADVTMTGLNGIYIGGFCGILLQSGKIEHCTETGDVSGNNYTGGFVGVINSSTASLSNCSSAGTLSAQSTIGGFAGGCSSAAVKPTLTGNSSSVAVTSSGSNFGGFIGNAAGTFTSNHASGNVNSTGGGNGGGFAGGIWEASTGSSFSKNYATGNVSGTTNLGGLIGYIGGDLSMSDCFATGNVGTSAIYNQKYGALVGFTSDSSTNITSGVSISNCYGSGDVEGSFANAGLIGRIGLATTTVTNCAAWSAKVYPHTIASGNWSSGAVVGVTFPTCTLTDNYRNPSMDLTAYWVPDDLSSFQHPNVSSTHPLTDSTGAEISDTSNTSSQAHYPQYPYHGKVEAGKTLSQLASTTLGWSSDVWDFSDSLPTLR